MTMKDISTAKDPDVRNALVALKRAARMARETAIATGTSLVIMRDGKIVHVPPDELIRELEEEDAKGG